MLISATKHSSCKLRINRKSAIKSNIKVLQLHGTDYLMTFDVKFRSNIELSCLCSPHTMTVRTEILAQSCSTQTVITSSNSRLLFPRAFDVTSKHHDAFPLQHKCKVLSWARVLALLRRVDLRTEEYFWLD